MKIDRLGRAFTLLAVFLMLALGAVNLFTLALYGQLNSELKGERADRQTAKAALWAARISETLRETTDAHYPKSLLSGFGSTEKEIEELLGLAVYNPDGTLLSKWSKSVETNAQTAEEGIDDLLPPTIKAISDPCSKEALEKAIAFPVQSHLQKIGPNVFTVYTVPIVHSNPGSRCVGHGTVVYRSAATGSSRLLLAPLIQILTVLTIAVGGFLLLRFLLRPAAASGLLRAQPPAQPSADPTQFVFGSLQSLIDGLQSEREELARLRDLEREHAAFIEQFNERIVTSIPSGLVVVEQSGYVVVTNGRARALFNASKDGGKLQPFKIKYEEFFHGAPRLCELVAAGLKEERTIELEEFEAARPDGGRSLLAAAVSPMGWRAQGISGRGALCLISDLTEVMELRQRLRLQENLANLGEMAAGIAHEFKNSLAAISGYGQLLQSIASDQAVKTPAVALVVETQNLSQMVTDFLNFARPQQLQKHPLSLLELIEDCRDALLPKAQRGSARLEIEGEFPDILGDYTLLRRAFLNLIENGIDAVETVDDKRVSIFGSIDSENKYALIKISDTGIGIPAADLDKIFIPFFTTKSRGYGIGLALVQKIVLAHEGRVDVTSEEGAGTTFVCSLQF